MPENIADVAAFSAKIASPQLTVVHFCADWAEQCQHVNDLLDTLAKQPVLSAVSFAKCDAEELSEVSLRYKIEAAPTVLLFKSGKSIDRIDGADPAKITSVVREHAGNATDGGTLDDRLRALVNRADVMLFMKGDRRQPRCGFSRTIIDILNGTNVAYETFDILTDEEVRQGLKKFSDWPTYPQLYVKGELIGGLDIVKELQASGELAATLSG